MWFGTFNGLNRYSGYEVSIFSNTHEDTISLSNKRIKCLYESSDGHIWIGTENGLNILDQSTHKLIKYFVNENLPYSKSSVSSIVPGCDNTVFVSLTTGEVFKFFSSTNFKKLCSVSRSYLSQIELLNSRVENKLWVRVNNNEVIEYSVNGEQLNRYYLPANGGVKTVLIDSNNENTAYSFGSEVMKFRLSTGKPFRDTLLDSLNNTIQNATSAHISKSGKLYIAYNDGSLIKLDKNSTQNLTQYIKPRITGAPRQIFESNDGTLWVSSNFEIIKFHPPLSLFERHLYRPPHAGLSEKFSLRGFAEGKDGNIYIGGYSGLIRYNPKQLTFLIIPMMEKHKEIPKDYFPYRLLPDDSGNMWIVSEGKGLYRYSVSLGGFELPVHDSPDQISKIARSYSIQKINDHLLLLGTEKGLLQYDISQNQLLAFPDSQPNEVLKGQKIMDIVSHEDSTFWVATYNQGVFKVHLTKGIIQTYNAYTTPALSHNSVSSLALDSKGNVWAGTLGGGINFIEVENKEVDTYRQIDGLANDIVAGIIPENDSIIWISTFNGLSRFDFKNQSFSNYSEQHGLNDNEFNIASAFKSKSGKMYFGGLNGFNSFFPKNISGNGHHYKSRIFLTGLIYQDNNTEKEYDLNGVLSHIDQVDLGFNNKSIELHFALNDYSNQQQNKFYYKFDGVDEEWRTLGNSNHLRFSSLSPGTYHLRIKGKSSNEAYSENEIRLKIHVNGIFYQQVWFYSIVLIMALSIVLIVFKYRLNQEMKLQNLRIKLSSDLHDEVGSILSRISMKAEMIKSGFVAKHDVENELTKIEDESRLATSSMSDVLWSIDARNDKLVNLIDYLREHAEEMLLPKGVKIVFNTGILNENMDIPLEKRQNVFYIFKEAINNIVKHSDAKTVRISVHVTNQKLSISIIDDGTAGKGENIRLTGQGIKNMKMRAQSIKGNLQIENDGGYQVYLNLSI